MDKKPAFGYLAFGGQRRPAAPVAVVGGLVLAAIFGIVVAQFREDYSQWWQTALIYGLCAFPILCVLTWAIVVDRSSLTGAVRDPENSVEATWLTRAAAHSFFLVMGGLGLVVTGFVIFGPPIVAAVLVCVCVAMMISLVGFYLWEVRGER